jgi:exopolysaccharide biosynthesis polyprenyl glycosylphosphotransferase
MSSKEISVQKQAEYEPWYRKFSMRKLILVTGDLIVVNGILLVIQLWRGELSPSWEGLRNHCYWFVTMSILWLLVGAVFRIYSLPKAYSVVHSLKSTLSAAIVVDFLNILLPVISPSLPARRSEIGGGLLMMLVGAGLWRVIFARSFVHPGFHRRALVVGAGWAGDTLVKTMSHFGARNGNPYLGKGYELLGFIDDDKAKKHKVISGLPVLGTSEDLLKVVRELAVDDIILAITKRGSIEANMFQAILDCREHGISVVSMQTLYERLTDQVPLDHAGNNLEVIIPWNSSMSQRLYPVFREMADIISGLIGFSLLCGAIPFVWVVNRITSRGPLFYRQRRVGKSGKHFMVLKFRTMVVDAEQNGAVWATVNDDRITAMGRFLRKSRLDELPQFWNVLRGEMSLIGPRPERPCFVEMLEKEIRFYRLRHAVKPGITGWAQVHYGYGATVKDAFVKLGYDFYYIKNQSIFLDFMILLRTVSVVLGFKGR